MIHSAYKGSQFFAPVPITFYSNHKLLEITAISLHEVVTSLQTLNTGNENH